MEAVNLQATENEIYNFLQSLMPKFLFINPYHNNVPIPNEDYGEFNIINQTDIGLNQRGKLAYNIDEDVMEIDYNQLKEITIQIDFYGPNALTNCNFYKQCLKVSLQNDKGKGLLDLKDVSVTRNLTFLQPNKEFMRRYNFDITVYIVDTIQLTSPYIESATIEIINRGNGEG